jgi:hypothetical protein
VRFANGSLNAGYSLDEATILVAAMVGAVHFAYETKKPSAAILFCFSTLLLFVPFCMQSTALLRSLRLRDAMRCSAPFDYAMLRIAPLRALRLARRWVLALSEPKRSAGRVEVLPD